MSWTLPILKSTVEFPGRAEWRWHLQLEFERIASPLRAALIALVWLWWFLVSPAHAVRPEVGLVVVASAVFVVTDLMVVHRWSRILRALPFGSVVADLLLVTAIVRVTGAAASPFLPVFFITSATAALRLTPRTALLLSPLFPIAMIIAAPGSGFTAAVDFLLTLGAAIWSGKVHEARIQHLRDPLTGVFTRSYALFHLEQLSQRATRPFTVGLVDLDHFKQVNDTYGHVAGDEVLRQYVRVVQTGLRSEDLLARYGGDELIVVWSDVGLAEALAVAERLRATVEAARLPLRTVDDAVQVTVSIGVFQAVPGTKPIHLLRQVDECLYASKRLRNEVTALGAREAWQPPIAHGREGKAQRHVR
jgi:diguanylate cyclase (GGDEF)-like protein